MHLLSHREPKIQIPMARRKVPGIRRFLKMPNRFASPKVLWNAVMERIVQDVPSEMAFCEFQCHRLRCTLETTGTCDIHPNLSLVMPGLLTLMPTPKLPNLT